MPRKRGKTMKQHVPLVQHNMWWELHKKYRWIQLQKCGSSSNRFERSMLVENHPVSVSLPVPLCLRLLARQLVSGAQYPPEILDAATQENEDPRVAAFCRVTASNVSGGY